MDSKRWYFLLGLVILGGSAATFYFQANSPVSMKHAPSFELKDDRGSVYSFSGSLDQVTLLHFWATWCPPCLEELPHVMKLARTLEGEAFRIVAVSLDKNWDIAKKAWPKEVPSNVISLIDPEMNVSEAYGSYKFPESYLVGKDRKILMKWVGPQQWQNERVLGFLRAQL